MIRFLFVSRTDPSDTFEIGIPTHWTISRLQSWCDVFHCDAEIIEVSR
jgi:predicted transposase YbfD/YdcC